MTRGRRGEKTYTGFNGAATDVLRGKDKLRVGGSGIDGRIAPPSQHALREFIESQTCPWCAAGPFQVLATHTFKVHGVSAAELRDLAGLTRSASVCSETHAAMCADRGRGRPLADSAYTTPRRPRTYSEAGLVTQRAKLTQSRTPEQQQRAARVSGDRQIAANAAKHAEILKLYSQGELLSDIATVVGVSRPTVTRTLRRAGITVDGRTRRWRLDAGGI
jgi:hypothetical protein